MCLQTNSIEPVYKCQFAASAPEPVAGDSDLTPTTNHGMQDAMITIVFEAL